MRRLIYFVYGNIKHTLINDTITGIIINKRKEPISLFEKTGNYCSNYRTKHYCCRFIFRCLIFIFTIFNNTLTHDYEFK
ncbi:hypothetical protein BSCG_01993 [Bacteroides sp. 2_2_4]|nr:hypothetical protein BSCG_01993 [Bacteroides sp. 2_2_4]